jgi:hypothetical protein
MKKLTYTFLIIIVTLCAGCETEPPQRTFIYAKPIQYIGNPYGGITVQCVLDPYNTYRYRYDTHYPYGENTFWYGMPCR